MAAEKFDVLLLCSVGLTDDYFLKQDFLSRFMISSSLSLLNQNLKETAALDV